MLHDCGVKCRHLVYWGPAHADFVIGWRTSPPTSKAGPRVLLVSGLHVAFQKLKKLLQW